MDLHLQMLADLQKVHKTVNVLFSDSERAIRITYDPTKDNQTTPFTAATVAIAAAAGSTSLLFAGTGPAPDTRIQYGAVAGSITILAADPITLKQLVDYINTLHNEHGWFAELLDIPGGFAAYLLKTKVATTCLSAWLYHGVAANNIASNVHRILGKKIGGLKGIRGKFIHANQNTLEISGAGNGAFYLVNGDEAADLATPVMGPILISLLAAPAAPVSIDIDNVGDIGKNFYIVFQETAAFASGLALVEYEEVRIGCNPADMYTSGQNPDALGPSS